MDSKENDRFAVVKMGGIEFLVHVDGFMVPMADILAVEWGDTFLDAERRTPERAGVIVIRNRPSCILSEADLLAFKAFARSMAIVWPLDAQQIATRRAIANTFPPGAPDLDGDDDTCGQIGPGEF